MSNFNSILPYLKSIRALPKLSSKDFSELLGLYLLTKSLDARNEIINYYLPLVPQLIVRYVNQGVELNDLLQSANLKLIEVIEALPYLDIDDIRGYIVKSINNRLIDITRKSSNINHI